MKIRMSSLSCAVAVVLALVSGPSLRAGEPPHPPRTGEEGDRTRGETQETLMGRLLANTEVASRLGLSETQIETLRSSARDIRQRQNELRADMEQTALDQARMLTGETIDEDELMGTVERLGKVRTEMAKLHIRQLLVIRKTLDKEQLQKLQAMRQGRPKGPARDRQKRPWQERNPPPAPPAKPDA